MNPDLLAVIHAVRRRWRLRVLLRGLGIVAAGGVAIFLVAAWGVDRLRFTPAALLAFRLVAWGGLLALTYRYVVRPLWRRITDQQVALYLEEHEPTLDGQVLGALALTGGPEENNSRTLLEKVVERAMTHLEAVELGRRIERPALRRSGGVLAGVTATAALLVLVGPAGVRSRLPFLVAPVGGPEIAPYTIAVSPGDSTIARGADLRIRARLHNFTAEDVTLVLRAVGATEWERVVMTPDEDAGDHAALLFDLRDSTEYFVTAGGVRSAIHRLAVADLPYVQSIALEYRFPAYTGLEPQRHEDGGDIAALIGTQVRIEIQPTLATAGGALVVGADTLPLAAEGTGLVGRLQVKAPGSYRVLLAGPDGRLVTASPEYFIDALEDQPPAVRLARPGRDVTVTSVDELFTEVSAEDDYGLARVELVYAVNGGTEATVTLYGGGRRKDVTAGHTFYLEELSLVPGDVIAYFARARDTRAGAEAAATDIYFATIRPFDQRWRQADESGAAGMQGGGVSPGELSQRQRDIIAATFRLVRDRARYEEREWRDHLSTVTLMQGRLREEVETLVRRMESRGVAQVDSTMALVAEALPRAAEAMGEAEEQLGRRAASEALPPEQRALQHLQRAEAAFRERQLSRGQQGGGGGGGASAANAEELAELFELELDRMRNQYESVERGRRQEADQEVDQALEKLRELARRQQQENERLRAQAQGTPDATGNGSQRRLAQETETLARQLERLAREQRNRELSESARRLQEAADAMRRASGNLSGAAQGNAALDRLRDARRRLEQSRGSGTARDVNDALRRAERLAEEQRGVQQDVRTLPEQGSLRQERLRRLTDRKQEMAKEVERLESDLDRLAREARGRQPEAAERLRTTANAARDTRLQDKILYSRGVVQQRSREYAESFEEQIASDIEALRRGIAEAADRMGESSEQQLEGALDRTREVTRALESLEARARQGVRPGPGGDSAAAGAADERQLRRELRERLNDLRELQQQLERSGADVGPLDGIRRQLGRFDNQGMLGTPRALDELRDAIVQGLKEYEFALRRQLLGGNQPPAALAPGEDVPPEYRALVEEYYRRLAERRR